MCWGGGPGLNNSCAVSIGSAHFAMRLIYGAGDGHMPKAQRSLFALIRRVIDSFHRPEGLIMLYFFIIAYGITTQSEAIASFFKAPASTPTSFH